MAWSSRKIKLQIRYLAQREGYASDLKGTIRAFASETDGWNTLSRLTSLKDDPQIDALQVTGHSPKKCIKQQDEAAKFGPVEAAQSVRTTFFGASS
jgi:hypothetical protein